MVALEQPKLSVGRVQDWINTVINPILDGMRRELRVLPAGPWRWVPATRSFEHFLPIKEYVPPPYDNYEDFVEKYPEVLGEFGVHDGVVEALGKEFERGFELLSSVPGEFQPELAAAAPSGSREWFVSYLVGRFKRLPDYYVGHDAYNRVADRLLAISHEVLSQAGIDVLAHAKQLAQCNERLVKQLTELRRDLADQYGARVRPSP